MLPDLSELTGIGLALALGLLIGLQRGWVLRGEKPGSRFAGIRTYGLLGLAGGIAGELQARAAGFALALVAGAAVLLLVVELLNSAVEAAIDRVGPEWHALSKRAKDLGSAAVLLTVLLCASVWCAAIYQRFFHG